MLEQTRLYSVSPRAALPNQILTISMSNERQHQVWSAANVTVASLSGQSRSSRGIVAHPLFHTGYLTSLDVPSIPMHRIECQPDKDTPM